jgi:hypothetical protein
MTLFKFGSPVIPSGSAANPIVLDHTPQELATLVAQSDDKARFWRFPPACARCFIGQSNPLFQVTQSIMVGQFDKLLHFS